MSLHAVMGRFVPLLLSLNYLGGQMGSENGKATLKRCLQGFFSHPFVNMTDMMDSQISNHKFFINSTPPQTPVLVSLTLWLYYLLAIYIIMLYL